MIILHPKKDPHSFSGQLNIGKNQGEVNISDPQNLVNIARNS